MNDLPTEDVMTNGHDLGYLPPGRVIGTFEELGVRRLSPEGPFKLLVGYVRDNSQEPQRT